ncbi:MAG TPA: lipopolysaccharide heptosyltransferase II [Nitrospiraceae bacterium]|nr:lipopolysaccharide heptosyltransferase II [Nitrospiraceae bacterium]
MKTQNVRSSLSPLAHDLPPVRILIRGTNWIGDAVMSEPALSAIRQAFPKADITLLVKPAIAELFQQHPAVDHLLIYEHRGRHARLSGKWALGSELRRGRFDVAILLQNAFEAALLSFLAGIPRRYGYGTDGRAFLLSDAITVPHRTAVAHQTQYYLDLLRPLGITPFPSAPRLFVSDSEDERMRQRLTEAGIQTTERLIGINPGSTYGSAKRWLPERFAHAADRVVEQFGGRVAIVGAAGEEALGRAIAEKMLSKPVVLSGRTSMRELMSIIKRCRLFITNDTGPMHIAAAFDVPVVAIFGPTDFRTTSPFGETHQIVRQPVECSPCLLRECPIDHRCMTGVTVEHVYEAAAKQLHMQSAKDKIADPVSESSTQHPALSTFDSALSTQGLPLAGVTVFLDRDGTVNRDTGYITSPQELDLFPGVVEAVARLNRAGARVVLVTNQSAIARGFMTVDQLQTIHAVLLSRLEAGGARLDAVYYCPHHPNDGCRCRKPQPAMIHRAAADLALDLSRAYVIGDQPRDIELARQVGARAVLVLSGQTTGEAARDMDMEPSGIAPDFVAEALGDAVEWIFLDVNMSHQPSAFSGQS